MAAPVELPQRKIAGYGWRRDTPDFRDHLLAIRPTAVPAQASLRSEMPPIYDQGQLGSCTANSIGAVLEHAEMKKGQGANTPSRLFIYYGERVIEGSVRQDAGAEIRDGIKVVAKQGAPPETLWPYNIAKFANKPPTKAYTAAKKHVAISYARVAQSQAAIQSVVAGGQPISFGFTVYDSFESQAVANNGIMPMPSPSEGILGGHAVTIIGYKQINGSLYFEVRNSWGTGWGDAGHFWMPAAYLLDTNLCSDFWSISGVS